MGQRIPHAKHVVVPDAGHGVNIDQPVVVNRLLDEFLTGVT